MARKLAAVYLPVLLLASTTTITGTPRLCAASNASAMGLLVKEYPATSISFSAAAMPLKISWRDSPFGEKATSKYVSASASDFGHAVRHSKKSNNPHQIERHPARIARMYGVILLRYAVVAYMIKIKKSINKIFNQLKGIPIREIMHICKKSREDSMATNKLAVIVGENISERRRRLGLSQKELADRLEISQDAMARMEKGRIAPKMGRLQNIADNLQCTVAYLFRTNDEATEERAASIADILKTLPADGQEALVELVASAARVMRSK